MSTIQRTADQHSRIISQGSGSYPLRHHEGLGEADESFIVSVGFRAPPVQDGSAFRPKSILLVEDNDDLREVVDMFLNMVGFNVVACCDAQVASAAFRSSTPIDLLLSDLEMPGRSGLELARELTDLRPSLPVMIVSGAFITDNMSSEMRVRNWKFLAKPYGLPDILSNLKILLNCQLQAAA